MENIRKDKDFYFEGVEYVEPNAIARSEVIRECNYEKPVRIAIFDMDGTIVNTSSPVQLVKQLFFEHKISIFNTFRIFLWGLSYKFQLPRKNNPVRERVFRAFKGKDAKVVSKYLIDFFDNKIASHIRQDALIEMERVKNEGNIILVLSASFDSVAARAIKYMPIDFVIATNMKIDNQGRYLNIVDGVAPEGDGKLFCFEEFANHRFGCNNWEVIYAYGDHKSDLPILEKAKYPCAICPDNALKRYAKKNNMKIFWWR